MGIESEAMQRVRGTESKGAESWGFTDTEGADTGGGFTEGNGGAETWKQMEEGHRVKGGGVWSTVQGAARERWRRI